MCVSLKIAFQQKCHLISSTNDFSFNKKLEFAIAYSRLLFLLMLYFVHFPVFNYYNFHIPSTAHFLSPCSPHCCGLYIIRLYNHPCTSWHLAWSLPPQTLSLRPPSHCYQQPAGCIHAGVIAVHIPLPIYIPICANFCDQAIVL